jgi:arylsulfatase A-like enzyme
MRNTFPVRAARARRPWWTTGAPQGNPARRAKSLQNPELLPIVRVRNLFLAAGALALASLPACFRGGKQTNILLVMVESLRYDSISDAPGAAHTPNLHQLAEQGVAFRSCFSHAPASQPALASLLSSRLPHEHGLTSDGSVLDEDVALLPEWLGKRGYQTFAAFGVAGSLPGKGERGLERGFSKVIAFGEDLAPADEVLDSFEAFVEGSTADQPWFGMLQLSETRQPFDAGEHERVEAQLARDGGEPETLSIGDGCSWERTLELPPGRTRFTLRGEAPLRVLRFAAGAGKRVLRTVFERGTPQAPAKEFVVSVENPDGEPLTCKLEAWFHDAPTQAESRRRYRDEVEAVDRAVGRLLEYLSSRGLYENTLVVLTSTHGLALGEHEHLGRDSALFDEFLHVPLLIKPAAGDARREQLLLSQSDVTRLMDLVPTMLELADVRPMPGAGGASLLEHRRRELMAETHDGRPEGSAYLIRDERFKLVLGAAENRYAMYDMRSDTLELENIFPLQGQHKLEWQRRLGALVGGVHALPPKRSDARFAPLGY